MEKETLDDRLAKTLECSGKRQAGGVPPIKEEGTRGYYHLHPFFPICWDCEGGASHDDSTLQFSGNFKTSNLSRACVAKFSTEMAFQEDYLIGLRPDPVIDGREIGKSVYPEWFCFSLSNVDPNKAYKFHCFPIHRKSMERIRPLLSNLSSEEDRERQWQRAGFDCECVPLAESLWLSYASAAGYGDRGFEGAYVYTFTIRFSADISPDDRLVICSNQPYGRLHLEQGLLNPLIDSPHVRQTHLIDGDDRFPLLVVTEEGKETKNGGGSKVKGVAKPIIVVMARLKSADVASSYAVEGFLLHLACDNTPEMRSLRQSFVFYVCPFMNPDGATSGLSRSDHTGHNLRHCWKHPDRAKHPQVYYLKKLLRRTHKAHRLLAFLEFAGSASARSSVSLEGVEEVVSSHRSARLEASTKNDYHPCARLPVPSPWALVYQLMQRLRHFRFDRCSFLKHSFAKHSRVQAGAHAAASLTHHPLSLTLRLCSVVPAGEGGVARYDCLSGRHWFGMGRTLLAALHDLYFGESTEAKAAAAAATTTALDEEQKAPASSAPAHPYMTRADDDDDDEAADAAYLHSSAYRTAVLALTHGQGMMLDRHRSTVIQRAFENSVGGCMGGADAEEGDSEDDDSAASMSSDDSIYSDDSGAAAAIPAPPSTTSSSEGKGREEKPEQQLPDSSDDDDEDDDDAARVAGTTGGQKALGAKIQIGSGWGRYLDEEEARTLRLKQHQRGNGQDGDDLSAKFRFIRNGPLKKRAEEEYRVQEDTFESIIGRYRLRGAAAKSFGGSMTGKFPSFKDLIDRDEERWLASHYPRKDRIGKSTKLDEQLEALLGATGALDNAAASLRGSLSPPTIPGTPPGVPREFEFRDSNASTPSGALSPIAVSISTPGRSHLEVTTMPTATATTTAAEGALSVSAPSSSSEVSAPSIEAEDASQPAIADTSSHQGRIRDSSSSIILPSGSQSQSQSQAESLSAPLSRSGSGTGTWRTEWHVTESLDSDLNLDLPLLYSLVDLESGSGRPPRHQSRSQSRSVSQIGREEEVVEIGSPRVMRVFGEGNGAAAKDISAATPPRTIPSSRVPNSILKSLRRKIERPAHKM